MTLKNPITLCLQVIALTLLLLFVANKTSARMESAPLPGQQAQVTFVEFNTNPPIYLTNN
jgi:fumarate reductase subunit C